MKSVTVKVRSYGGTYIARAGRGRRAKTASCTSTPEMAAQRAAAKFFGLDSCTVQNEADVELTGDWVSGQYTAKLPGRDPVNFLEWDIAADGRVLESRPLQTWVWSKGRVLNVADLKVGGKVRYQNVQGITSDIRYPIEHLKGGE